MGVAVGVGGGAGVQDDGSGTRHSTIEVTAAATTTGLAALPPPPPDLGGCICGREMSRVSEGREREAVRVRLDIVEKRYSAGGSDRRCV